MKTSTHFFAKAYEAPRDWKPITQYLASGLIVSVSNTVWTMICILSI